MEQIIKNMNAKPLLERVEYEKLNPPEKGAVVNFRVGDEIKVEEVKEDVVKVTIARTIASEPECIFKGYVEMSVEVQINKEAYDALPNKEDYFKKSAVSRLLVSQIVTVVANLTTNSAIGPMITVPMMQ